MWAGEKFPQNPRCLAAGRESHQARVSSRRYARIRRCPVEGADMEKVRIKPGHDFARITHLSIWKSRVGETVKEYADPLQAILFPSFNWQRPSQPSTQYGTHSIAQRCTARRSSNCVLLLCVFEHMPANRDGLPDNNRVAVDCVPQSQEQG